MSENGDDRDDLHQDDVETATTELLTDEQIDEEESRMVPDPPQDDGS